MSRDLVIVPDERARPGSEAVRVPALSGEVIIPAGSLDRVARLTAESAGAMDALVRAVQDGVSGPSRSASRPGMG